MSPHKGYKREEVLRALQQFAKDSGRPPKSNEPGFERVVIAAKREFGSWEYALKVAGLQTFKKWSEKKTLAAKARRLLNHNPLTFNEIKQELKRTRIELDDIDAELLAVNIANTRGIESMGPRKSKVYFVSGQEDLATARLDVIFSQVSPEEEALFSSLAVPMTKIEILRSLSIKEAQCKSMLEELLSAKLIFRARFVAHARGGMKYNASELFGDLAGKCYYCRLDYPESIVTLIIESISKERLRDSSFSNSLSRKLREILPKEIFKVWQRKVLWMETFKTYPKGSLDSFLQP